MKLNIITLLSFLFAQAFALDFSNLPSSTRRGTTLSAKQKGKLRKRDLKSSKKSKSNKLDTFKVTLYTDFDGDSESGDMDDDVGEAHIEFDGHDSDTFDLSYYIGSGANLKDHCDDDECYFKIRKGKCDDMGSTLVDEDDTGFTTNFNGRAAGTLFNLESEEDGEDHKCRILVLYGHEDSSDDESEKIACGYLVPEDEEDDYCDDHSWSRRH